MNAMKTKEHCSKALISDHALPPPLFGNWYFCNDTVEEVNSDTNVKIPALSFRVEDMSDEEFKEYLKARRKYPVLSPHCADLTVSKEEIAQLTGTTIETPLPEDWVNYDSGKVHKWIELYCHPPVVDLGCDFGKPELYAGFVENMSEIDAEWRLDFTATDGYYYEPNDEVLKYLPRYIGRDTDRTFYSPTHWYSFVTAILNDCIELRERLTDRRF